MGRSAIPAGNNAVAVILDQLRNQITGQYVNDATVSATAYAVGTGAVVAGQAWPLSMPLVAEPGKYAGVIAAGSDIVEGQTYDIKITIQHSGHSNEQVVRGVAKENRIELNV
jgi:hypothetical protein